MKFGVSVLIPVHGYSPFLESAIMSVLDQDMDEICDLELLIVLDRPDVLTVELLEKFSDQRIRVLESVEPGLVAALNLGLDASKHELIARLDADDKMIKNRLKTQILEFKKNAGLVLLGSQTTWINSNDEVIGASTYPTNEKALNKMVQTECVFAHPSVMMKKSAVVAVGKYRNFYRHAEDFDLWARLAKLGSIKNLDLRLTDYRHHASQVSVKYSKEQAISTLAVVKSNKLRAIGKPDLSDTYTDLNEWFLSTSGFSARIKVWSNFQYSLARRKRKFVLSLFFFIVRFLVSPHQSIKNSWLKIVN